MSSQPYVSVIMPAYNGMAYIGTAIRSVLNQTEQNIELIVVNDCSSDNTASIIDSHKHDPRLICIENDHNLGVAGSRNEAIKLARGTYLAFLDQDDVWLPSKLQIQLSVFQSDPEIALVHSRTALIDNKGDLLPRYANLESREFNNGNASVRTDNVFRAIFIQNNIQVPTVMIKKSAFDELGPFNVDIPGVDDYELWMKIALHYRISSIDTILALYRIHEDQQSKNTYKMLVNKMQALENVLAHAPDCTHDLIDRETLEQRMQGIYSSVGDYYAYIEQNYKKASTYYKKAINLKGGDLHSLLKLFYCVMPDMPRNMLRVLKNILAGKWV